MLADFVGYPAYALATFIIKALMASLAYLIAKLCKPLFKKCGFVAYILAGIASEIVMISGYFVFEAVFLGYDFGALVSILPNTMQAIVGIAVATVLMAVIDRTNLIEKIVRKRDRKK